MRFVLFYMQLQYLSMHIYSSTVIIITEKLDPILQSSLILAARAKTLRKQYYS